MGVRFATLLGKASHNRWMRWHIGATDTERDDCLALFSHIVYLAQLFGEVVLPYSVKSLRECRLERFCHNSKSVFLL